MSLHRPLKHRFAADAEALPLARIMVRHWLADGDMGPEVAQDVLFAANELCTHGVQACPGGWCQLEGWEDDEGVRLEVSGHPSPASQGERIVHLAPGSPALELLERLCEQVDVEGGDRVMARCTCRRTAAASDVAAS